jgi:hypothetical protein
MKFAGQERMGWLVCYFGVGLVCMEGGKFIVCFCRAHYESLHQWSSKNIAILNAPIFPISFLVLILFHTYMT